jgi:uncharacterized protein (UPF0305 family)
MQFILNNLRFPPTIARYFVVYWQFIGKTPLVRLETHFPLRHSINRDKNWKNSTDEPRRVIRTSPFTVTVTLTRQSYDSCVARLKPRQSFFPRQRMHFLEVFFFSLINFTRNRLKNEAESTTFIVLFCN